MKPVVREKMKLLVPVMVFVFAFTCLGLNQVVYGQLEKVPEKALKGAVKEVVGTEKAAPEKEKQPQMQKALDALKTAKAELQKATADKGGHRAKAMDLIDQAIKEVHKGIEYDKTHK